MSEPLLTMSHNNIPETTLWIGMYRDAMQAVIKSGGDVGDFRPTGPEFAAAAADQAVPEFRKRTDRGRVAGPPSDPYDDAADEG